MGLISIDVVCDTCGHRETVAVDRDMRNEDRFCTQGCGGLATRAWGGFSLAVSTEKLSESIPDNVASGRFDHLRDTQQLKRELTKTKQAVARDAKRGRSTSKNYDDVKRLRQEIKQSEKT
jgi:hypothetical protein